MSKTDQAYDALKRDILSGALLPDEPLTVATLTARYGFGWTPLRDSLSRLEGENLVTLVRNRGYRVAGASFAELRDIQHAFRLPFLVSSAKVFLDTLQLSIFAVFNLIQPHEQANRSCRDGYRTISL